MVLSTRQIIYLGSVEAGLVIEERKQMFIHFNVYILHQKQHKNMRANVTNKI